MNALDAAYNVVHDYPGGAPSLAPRLNKSPHTLNHEVAGQGGAKLGLVDACKITKLTGDLRILHAFAESCNHMVIPLPDAVNATDNNVMQALGESSREFAELCQEVCSDMADGVISDNELQRIETARAELIMQLAHLGETIRACNFSGKPILERTKP